MVKTVVSCSLAVVRCKRDKRRGDKIPGYINPAVTLLFLTASTFVGAAFSRDKRQQHGYGTDCLDKRSTK
jgi:hypothetical protein